MILAVGLVACSEPLVFDDWTIPVPEGAAIIEHAHVPLDERTESIEMVQDLVIGGDGDPQTAFYQAWGVAVDDSGNMYVMEHGNLRVQVFDHEGRYVRTLGREGQGPGELQSPLFITVAGDSVVVIDERNVRMTRWSTVDGELLGGETMAEPSFEGSGLADGSLAGRHVIFHREPEFWREFTYGRYSMDGRQQEHYVTMRALPSASISVPYAWAQLVATPGGDVYITRADRYQVLAFEADGTPRWALRTSLVTPAIPADILDTAAAQIRERQPDWERPDNWPERMPAIGNMVVDGHGNLYVSHYAFVRRDPYTGEVLGEVPDRRAVDVYSPDGDLIAAAWSELLGWSAAWGDYVYSVGRDPETEEEVVRRYRLVRSWER
jgi:hypothetical protein